MHDNISITCSMNKIQGYVCFRWYWYFQILWAFDMDRTESRLRVASTPAPVAMHEKLPACKVTHYYYFVFFFVAPRKNVGKIEFSKWVTEFRFRFLSFLESWFYFINFLGHDFCCGDFVFSLGIVVSKQTTLACANRAKRNTKIAIRRKQNTTISKTSKPDHVIPSCTSHAFFRIWLLNQYIEHI